MKIEVFMTIKKLFIFVTLLAVVLIAWFAFSGEDEETKRKKEKARRDVALLLGGSSKGSDSESVDNSIKKDNEESIFDSDFYSVGKVDEVEMEDPSDYVPKGEIPINPQTGKPYSEEVMQQFQQLRKQFPENDLIPRRLTPEEKEEKQKQKQLVNKAQAAIRSNKANLEEVNLYFDTKEKEMKDRLEIVNYLVDSLKEAGETDETGQIDKILKTTTERLAKLQEERESAIQKVQQ